MARVLQDDIAVENDDVIDALGMQGLHRAPDPTTLAQGFVGHDRPPEAESVPLAHSLPAGSNAIIA